jgi:hypothetical protein
MLHISRTRFAPRIFRTADKGGSASGGGPAPSPTIEQQLTQSRDDLAAAQSTLNALTSERDTLASQVASLTTERDQIKSQFETLTVTATETKTKLSAAESAVASLTTERDGFKSKLDTATSHVTRLESLCGVKGVDPAHVPPALPPESAVKQMKLSAFNALSHAQRTAFIDEGGKLVD